ncbi:response regulator [Desulfatiglans anilini]|uniref:Response regulator receiver domain protein n=1 Tax=Uncultured Desulfatiglans sp. TaxID=1748965 RepID=A0A653A000_UNCDX|nr:response regulator [Desulfatiglans anilini]VBB41334.1 Response regulator receiver domain protein [uncultured Desulfatiglans sp.]
MPESILNNKHILIVDDEPDVLDALEEQLEGFEGLLIDRALDYERAQQLLHSWTYDLVILDIMGVRGFELLDTAVHMGFPAVMLTAQAFNREALQKSIELGARAYLPKEKLSQIVPFLEDVLTLSHQAGWKRLFERLGGVFASSFGKGWEKDRKQFWQDVQEGRYEPSPTILKR